MEIFSASDTLIRPTILRPLTERQWALISPALPSFNSTLGIWHYQNHRLVCLLALLHHLPHTVTSFLSTIAGWSIRALRSLPFAGNAHVSVRKMHECVYEGSYYLLYSFKTSRQRCSSRKSMAAFIGVAPNDLAWLGLVLAAWPNLIASAVVFVAFTGEIQYRDVKKYRRFKGRYSHRSFNFFWAGTPYMIAKQLNNCMGETVIPNT